MNNLSDLPVERMRRNWYQGMRRDGVKPYRPTVLLIFEFLEVFDCEFDRYYGPVVTDIRVYPDKLGTRTGYHYMSRLHQVSHRPANI